MDQAEQLSELIGEIYDAALDPSLWSGVLGKAGRFVGGPVAAIFSKSPTALTGTVYYHSSDISGPYRKLYFDKYIKFDPFTTGQYFSDVEQPMAVADIMPYQEFLETRFYKEWVQPQGMVDAVTAVLDKSVTTAAMFGVFRYQSDGVVDDETRRRMRLIVPHIRRAVLIGRLIDLRAADAASLAIYSTASARECALSMRGDASFTPMPPVTSFSTPATSCPRLGGGSSQAMRRLIRLFASCLQPPGAAMRQSEFGELPCR